MYANDADYFDSAKFQERCQFTTATQGIGKFGDDKFITSFQGDHQLFPQRSVSFVLVIFFNDTNTPKLIHPFAIFFQFVILRDSHNVADFCHVKNVLSTDNMIVIRLLSIV